MASSDGPTDGPRGAGGRATGGTAAWTVGRSWAAVLGVVAAGMTLAIAELLAAAVAWLGLVSPAASPFESLGAASIAVTPEWLKEFGIATFGQHDKLALAVAMMCTFIIVGAAIGLLSCRHPRSAVVAGAALTVVVGVAIVTRPAAGVAELIPLTVGAVVGLTFLWQALGPPAVDRHSLDVRALGGSADADAPAAGIDPGARVGGVAPAPTAPVAMPLARRRAFRLAGVGAIAAGASGVAARLLPEPVDVQANRAAVILPPVTSSGSAPIRRPSAGDTGSVVPAGGGSAAPTSPGTATIVIPPTLPHDANPDVKDLTPFVTPTGSFYRVDTAFTLPRVTTDAWRLKIHGMVDRPYEITWSDLIAMPQVERWITLACVSNTVGGDLVGNAAWQGVRLADLLAHAKPRDGTDCVLSTSADRFTVTTPLGALTDGRDALLAIGMDGKPLPVAHGYPVRMVVPGLYGYVSATKWVVDLEVTTFAHATAFWTANGWDARAPIKTASRIDTPHYDVSVGPGVVPVAGVAWAQHRGISAVEVQVDDGPWAHARLAGAASADTWVQWVYQWDTTGLAPGHHTLRCRATDGTGAVQTAEQRPPAPNGASGYDAVPVVVA